MLQQRWLIVSPFHSNACCRQWFWAPWVVLLSSDSDSLPILQEKAPYNEEALQRKATYEKALAKYNNKGSAKVVVPGQWHWFDVLCFKILYMSNMGLWWLQAGEQDVEEEDVSDGSGRSNKSEVQEDDAEEVIFDLLCKLFGFLICGIGNVGDIRHLVQCFLAHWYMKSCFWWFLCSYCKHLKSFGLRFAGGWWCGWRLIWVPKLWLIFYPFVFYLKGKITFGGRWEWVADLLQHVLQSRSRHSLWIAYFFHQSLNTSYRGVCFQGERELPNL